MNVTNTVLKKGDMIQVMAGREKGKTGKILKVLTTDTGGLRILVEKINMVKRHTKPTQKNQMGGLVDKEASLHVSNILLLCPKCNRGVRVAKKIEGDKKMRLCKKCGEKL